MFLETLKTELLRNYKETSKLRETDKNAKEIALKTERIAKLSEIYIALPNSITISKATKKRYNRLSLFFMDKEITAAVCGVSVSTIKSDIVAVSNMIESSLKVKESDLLTMEGILTIKDKLDTRGITPTMITKFLDRLFKTNLELDPIDAFKQDIIKLGYNYKEIREKVLAFRKETSHNTYEVTLEEEELSDEAKELVAIFMGELGNINDKREYRSLNIPQPIHNRDEVEKIKKSNIVKLEDMNPIEDNFNVIGITSKEYEDELRNHANETNKTFEVYVKDAVDLGVPKTKTEVKQVVEQLKEEVKQAVEESKEEIKPVAEQPKKEVKQVVEQPKEVQKVVEQPKEEVKQVNTNSTESKVTEAEQMEMDAIFIQGFRALIEKECEGLSSSEEYQLADCSDEVTFVAKYSLSSIKSELENYDLSKLLFVINNLEENSNNTDMAILTKLIKNGYSSTKLAKVMDILIEED